MKKNRLIYVSNLGFDMANIKFIVLFLLLFSPFVESLRSDDGYRLWLKYDQIQETQYLNSCREKINKVLVAGDSETTLVAKHELRSGLSGLLGIDVVEIKNSNSIEPGVLYVGTYNSLHVIQDNSIKGELSPLRRDGFLIKEIKHEKGNSYAIVANDDMGVLYGVFHFLRLLQTGTSLKGIHVASSPKVDLRMLNHWDIVKRGTVGRGYAGNSIWKWNDLPDKIDSRYIDYARANASIGINAVVLNNVNADPKILDTEYLEKIAVLANLFRPYGIRIFLSANFAAPSKLGDLSTADPLDPDVRLWWKEKVNEIYGYMPDFGGFIVKADCEGEPGPYIYNRTHADGANMMAEALAPHGGILIWRAFVYSVKDESDRAKMAYDSFISLDGEFNSNVFLQVKNGPLDFQPREPFTPLFGAMPKTNIMMEFQITQEYLGHSKALVYLAPLYKETLDSDTYASGKGSTVSRVLEGSVHGQKMTGMAAVPNIGDDRNWTGYTLAQSNWYAYGRLAWNYDISSEEIAEEWIRMTLSNDSEVVEAISGILLNSREIFVNYQTPLGLNVLTDWYHYEPDPAFRRYYHQADSLGLGYDRTINGSDAVSQYFPFVRDRFNNIHACPEKYMTWFHHVPWDFTMKSGRIFWDELCYKYNSGVKGVEDMLASWNSLEGKIDPEIFKSTQKLLVEQGDEAVNWRNVCLRYFSGYSNLPIIHTLQ